MNLRLGGRLGLVVLAIVVVIVILILLRRKKSPLPPPKPDACRKSGEVCLSGSMCCGSMMCALSPSGERKCMDNSLAHPESSFLLSTSEGCLGLVDGVVRIDTSIPCKFEKGVIPRSFWSWDGIKVITIISPVINESNGQVIDVGNIYLQTPTEGGYARFLTVPGDVRLTSLGIIYDPSYQWCLGVGSDGILRWNSCLGQPFSFTIIAPDKCSEPEAPCNSSDGCCPPYGSCIGGKCSKCFGDPVEVQSRLCPRSDYQIVCKDSTYQCQSRCEGEPKCSDSSDGSCQPLGPGKWGWKCTSKCLEKDKPVCRGSDNPDCLSSAESPSGTSGTPQWAWKCPRRCEDEMPPDPHTAPPPSPEYTPRSIGDKVFFEKDHLSAWIYPMWDCPSQTWKYVKGCNLEAKIECDSDKVPVCGVDTGMEWQCSERNNRLNYCGLSVKPECSDSVCTDTQPCGGPDASIGWKWICPSSSSLCEMKNYFGIKSINAIDSQGNHREIAADSSGTPLYPTINNSRCRSQFAADKTHPMLNALINNPPGNLILREDGVSLFLDKFDSDGKGKYVASLYK